MIGRRQSAYPFAPRSGLAMICGAVPRILACLALSALILPVQAQTGNSDVDAAEARLSRVETAINQINGWLTESRRQRSAEEQTLHQLSADITDIAQAMNDNQLRVAELDTSLAGLQQQRERLQRQSASQRAEMAGIIRATYLAGNHSQLKLLLNQQDPARAQRMLVYFEALNADRLTQLEQWQALVHELDQNASDIAGTRDSLTLRNAELQQQRVELQDKQQQRRNLIAELDARIAERGEELQQLEQDRQDLQALIEEINRIIEDIPDPDELMPFEGSRSLMPWPMQGELAARFGDRYGGGNLRRHGIIIAARPDTPVRAVHPGRVVFADWMRGSGNLVVIDHGNTYLTLYAHLQSLDKQQGDWVNRSEPVGFSGSDAGNGEPGLYFELRRNSQPLNPVDWLE